MYAKYNSFYNGGNCRPISSTGYTDSTRFACASIPQPPPPPKDETPQCQVDCTIPDPVCTYSCGAQQRTPVSAVLSKPLNTEFPSTPLPVVKENFTTKLNQKTPIQSPSNGRLLPVMDPEFNLREICKQIILLEDHLCHQEKRCTDCCIKHFLTIEALAEEAITLDKNNKYTHINTLPEKVRRLQRHWHENPSQNSLEVSQQLREIRKQYMISSFSIIFSEKSSCDDCSSGVCKIKQK